MEKKAKIFLLLFLISILLLNILSEKNRVEQITISGLKEEFVGKKVQIIGNIIVLKQLQNTLIVKIEDLTGSINGSFYSKENINFGKEKYILEGTIIIYKAQTQINIDKIRIYDP
jgi:RecJ-like exonuclease